MSNGINLCTNVCHTGIRTLLCIQPQGREQLQVLIYLLWPLTKHWPLWLQKLNWAVKCCTMPVLQPHLMKLILLNPLSLFLSGKGKRRLAHLAPCLGRRNTNHGWQSKWRGGCLVKSRWQQKLTRSYTWMKWNQAPFLAPTYTLMCILFFPATSNIWQP